MGSALIRYNIWVRCYGTHKLIYILLNCGQLRNFCISSFGLRVMPDALSPEKKRGEWTNCGKTLIGSGFSISQVLI